MPYGSIGISYVGPDYRATESQDAHGPHWFCSECRIFVLAQPGRK